MPETKNKPPMMTKDIKESAVFQHRLRASTMRPKIRSTPETLNLFSMACGSPLSSFQRLPKLYLPQ
ncbi:MAG: hypothetical protein WA618_07735, partial [Terriglobales bacterium]